MQNFWLNKQKRLLQKGEFISSKRGGKLICVCLTLVTLVFLIKNWLDFLDVFCCWKVYFKSWIAELCIFKWGTPSIQVYIYTDTCTINVNQSKCRVTWEDRLFNLYQVDSIYQVCVCTGLHDVVRVSLINEISTLTLFLIESDHQTLLLLRRLYLDIHNLFWSTLFIVH